jgi:serine/threonine-protein kinase HipA
MAFCHCCLKETEQDFCRCCSKLLFGVTNFSAKLNYNAPQLAFSEKGTVKRISISGAQIKFSAKIEEKTLTSTDIGGTHILKPVLQSIYENNQDSPANEHVTMLMARNIFKIPTALSALLYFDNGEPVYITKRFDVIESGNRAGQRLNQSDFAQIAGLIPERDGEDYKYKGSYERIAELISENVSTSKIAV